MKCHQCFLYYFTITCISSWKRPWPFIWTKLYFRHPRILCAKFGWNWLSGSRVEDFFYLVYVFSLFWWNLPFKKGWGPSFEKKLIPFTQGCFVQIWHSDSREEAENMKSLRLYKSNDETVKNFDQRISQMSLRIRWEKSSWHWLGKLWNV